MNLRNVDVRMPHLALGDDAIDGQRPAARWGVLLTWGVDGGFHWKQHVNDTGPPPEPPNGFDGEITPMEV